ncbi:MAG: cysteine hydrolase [Bacillus sp. (in: Bacteria)]|nr:cysteine hydrolase [Bacillus sp. (in: firmicutes)]
MKNNNTALVIIDMQKEGNFGLIKMEEAIQNNKELIATARNAEIPVIYTRQINRADGVGLSKGEPLNEDGTPFYYNTNTDQVEIIDALTPQEGDIIIDKKRWSAFYETDLDLTLRSLGVKEVIMSGVVTDGCLMTSVFDAYFRDYEVHLVHDASTASNEGAHMSSLLTMANWVYNLKIYDTKNMIQKLNAEAFDCWEPLKADSLQFTPETMKEQFQQILQPRKEV